MKKINSKIEQKKKRVAEILETIKNHYDTVGLMEDILPNHQEQKEIILDIIRMTKQMINEEKKELNDL